MTRTLRKSLALLLVLLFPIAVRAASDEAAHFNATEYLDLVKFLASDEMKGRAPGTPEMDKVADYIVEHFRAAGAKPAGVDGTWFQPFEIKRGRKLVDESAQLEFTGVKKTNKVREDWIPFPFSGTDDAEGDLVFAGFGIDAPEYKWNDYENIDVKDKVVLILRYEPRADDVKAAFGGKPSSRFAQFRNKADMAHKKGARAVLVVNPPEHTPADEPLYKFDERATREGAYPLPMAHITPDLANEVLRHGGLPDVATLQKQLESEHKPLSADLKTRVTLKTGLQQKVINAKNILARVDGDGTTDETIVIGAHYDHLGVAPRSFQMRDEAPLIHNGADDNASGTAGIIELAAAFAHGPKMHRNVLFIAFTGEEMGLLGSKYFVDHPTIPLERVKLMSNFDMIGRMSQDKLSVFGSSSGEELHDIVQRAVDKTGIHCEVTKGRGSFDSRSDHYPFFQHNIPILFTFTGIHPEYHQPEDDWELIDPEGATKVLAMNYLVLHEVGNMTKGPTFVNYEKQSGGGDEKPASEAADTHKSDSPGDARQASMPRVRMGIVPDYTESDKPGLVVDNVAPEGAAKEAGIEKGDRILRIGDKKITDIHAYMAALGEFKPADVVEVELERGGKNVVVKVTLKGAPGRARE